MKKFVIALTAAGLALTASVAEAGIFFGGRVGGERYLVENKDLNLDNGHGEYVAGGFLGYHTGFIRLEAEYLYHPKHRFKNFYKSETHTVMGNLFFSPPIKSMLRPYIMGGAGVGFHSITIDEDKERDHTFAWQAGVGLELEVSENVFLDVGGRYTDMGDPEHKDRKIETTGYSYYFGMRFEY